MSEEKQTGWHVGREIPITIIVGRLPTGAARSAGQHFGPSQSCLAHKTIVMRAALVIAACLFATPVSAQQGVVCVPDVWTEEAL